MGVYLGAPRRPDYSFDEWEYGLLLRWMDEVGRSVPYDKRTVYLTDEGPMEFSGREDIGSMQLFIPLSCYEEDETEYPVTREVGYVEMFRRRDPCSGQFTSDLLHLEARQKERQLFTHYEDYLLYCRALQNKIFALYGSAALEE